MATLASLVIKILGDTSGLEAAVDRAGGALGRIGDKAKQHLGKAAAVSAAGLAGVLTSSIATAANFEHAVDQVGAVANATAAEMDRLGKTALRIGKETAFSATEAAQAMEILAANGVSVDDILNGAADAAVALAAAGGTDLRTAADTASTAMTVWGLTAQEMTDVVNRLAGAANVSRFGVEDMAAAIAQGGGAAASAGVEFGDFSTAIAAMAPYFSSGSDAGTSFKTFIQRLTPDSDKAAKALQELGIITEDGANRFFDAEGNLKSFAEIVDILNQAVSGLSEEQQSQALSTIFGSDALRAAAALARVTGQEFTAMSTAMAGTSAADVAAQRMGNFKGSLEALRGSIETLQIELGMKFLPILTQVTTFLAQNPGVIMALAAVIGTAMVGAVVAWTAATIANTVALAAQAIALVAAYAPIILIVGALALLGVGIYTVIQNWDSLGPAVMNAVNGLKDAVVGAFNFVLEFMRSNWAEIASLILLPFAPLVILATDAFGIRSALLGALGGILEAVSGLASGAADRLGGFAAAVAAGVKGGVNEAINALNYLIDAWNQFKISVPGLNVAGKQITPGFEFNTPDIPKIPALASGLPNVPADMLAFLHKGEAVLPRQEAQEYRRAGGGLAVNIHGNVVVNNNALDQDANSAVGHIGYLLQAQLRQRGLVAL